MANRSISPFVGRAREVESLGHALSEADAGAGRFFAICGEPGMGKTRLITEFADIATKRGNLVVWSQMLEDPGVPPYFLWMPVVRACLRLKVSDTILEHLGPGVADLAHITPELSGQSGIVVSKTPSESSVARYQLYDSITRFFLLTSEQQPLVMLLDNLHLADRSSLALLQYFCQQIANGRVLVVGAYRDSDLDRLHILRPVLNNLSRGAGFTKVVMDGLLRNEVAELMHLHLAHPVPAQVLDSIYEQSGGNPLFITEVGNMLARLLPNEQFPGAGFHYKLPDSLHEVITARLDNLPVDTRKILKLAAILGREFDIALVGKLGALGVERVDRLLQPAETAGIISALGPSRYRFHHALYREVLYAGHNTVSRVTLHRKAGESLEDRYHSDLNAHLSQLAHHFFEAGLACSGSKAVHYCKLAAEAAVERRAYSEAVALYENALQAMELTEIPEPYDRFEMLMAMGNAQYLSGQLNTSTQTLMKATILAYRQHWWDRLAEALFLFQSYCQQAGLGHVASVPLHKAVLEHLPEDSAALRARVQASLARAYRKAAEPDLAAEAFKNSISLARECGDPGVLLDCLRKGAWTVGRNPAGVQLGLQISYETLELARCHGPPEAVIDALTDIVFQLCDMGEIAESQRVLKKLKADALQARQVHILNVVSGFETATAILQGRWSEALSGAREALSQVSLQGVYGLEGRFAFQMFAIRKAQGTLEEVADTATHIMESSNDSQFWAPGQILLHCELNQFRQARTALEQLGDLGKLPRDDLYGAALVFLAESCSKLRDIPRCKQLFTLLAPYRGLNVTLAGNLMFGAASGYLAMLAAIIENKSEARALFGEAILLNKSMRAEPALARTQADYARMLLSSNNEADHAHAGRLIAEAIHAAKRLLLKPVLNSIEEMISAAGFDSLTRREIEVLELIAAGSSNVKIAESLHISHSTVATHVRNIFRKTGASNRTEAAENARRAQLLLHD